MNRLWLTLLCLGVAACDPLEPTSPQAPELDDRQEEIAPPAISRHSKPTAPVELRSYVTQRGDLLEIQLSVSTSDPDAPIYVSLMDMDGATLVEPQLLITEAHRGGRVGGHRFLIGRDGDGWVQVLVEVDSELGSLSRSLAVELEAENNSRSVQKAADSDLQMPAAARDEVGEVLIALPAGELNLR